MVQMDTTCSPRDRPGFWKDIFVFNFRDITSEVRYSFRVGWFTCSDNAARSWVARTTAPIPFLSSPHPYKALLALLVTLTPQAKGVSSAWPLTRILHSPCFTATRSLAMVVAPR